jgi:replicative DNA helicase
MLKQEQPVVVFSLEMPTDSLTMRMLSANGRINQTQLRRGWIKDEGWDRLSQAVSRLRNRPLFINDTPSIGPSEIRAYLRKVQRQFGSIALIAIDYLQLMQLKGRSEGRTNEVSEISRNLKLIAREFDCPMIVLSQLNRELEKRPNKRPQMSDLRESGAIEQDADVIMFVYRGEVYEPNNDMLKGMAEIIIGKQRNGPLGTTHLVYNNSVTRFDNAAKGTAAPPIDFHHMQHEGLD